MKGGAGGGGRGITNEFDLHLNELVSKTDFHMKSFALGLVLKQRQREFGNDLLTYCICRMIARLLLKCLHVCMIYLLKVICA